MQLLIDGPTMDNYIYLPDASGTLVVDALAPLYISSAGTVSLEQGQIVQVGELTAGSIGPGFGKLLTACCCGCAKPH